LVVAGDVRVTRDAPAGVGGPVRPARIDTLQLAGRPHRSFKEHGGRPRPPDLAEHCRHCLGTPARGRGADPGALADRGDTGDAVRLILY